MRFVFVLILILTVMQITFNTEDDINDLSKIHEILVEAIKKKGGHPFTEYQLPEAIIALKQGLGRLIRNKSDKGLMAILDSRLFMKNYGTLFLQSLPPSPIYHTLEEVKRKLPWKI